MLSSSMCIWKDDSVGKGGVGFIRGPRQMRSWRKIIVHCSGTKYGTARTDNDENSEIGDHIPLADLGPIDRYTWDSHLKANLSGCMSRIKGQHLNTARYGVDPRAIMNHWAEDKGHALSPAMKISYNVQHVTDMRSASIGHGWSIPYEWLWWTDVQPYGLHCQVWYAFGSPLPYSRLGKLHDAFLLFLLGYACTT